MLFVLRWRKVQRLYEKIQRLYDQQGALTQKMKTDDVFVWIVQQTIACAPDGRWDLALNRLNPEFSKYDFLATNLQFKRLTNLTDVYLGDADPSVVAKKDVYWQCWSGLLRVSARFLHKLSKHVGQDTGDGKVFALQPSPRSKLTFVLCVAHGA